MSDTGETWAVLRGLRATPPGLAASNNARREVFAAALEQAEQFLTAADAVGYATKPVQLFYALSQAGRAIAAVRATGPWEIHGHGIHADEKRDIGATTIRPDASAIRAMQLVAAATGSDVWDGAVELGAVWASLPELRYEPSLCRDAPGVLEAQTQIPETLNVSPSTAGFHTRVGVLLEQLAPQDKDELHNAVSELLAPYPTAEGWVIGEPYVTFGNTTTFSNVTTTWILPPDPRQVVLEWPIEVDGQRGLRAAEGLTEPYAGRLYFRPGIGAQNTIPSPLITWWGVLFALSTLARYEPVAWRAALDIDSSPTARALEQGLTVAQRRIPELVLEAVTQTT